jgi:hypothetical protein
MLKLLAVAEIVILAHEHATKLDPDERRRLLALVRVGRGRSRNLRPHERDELRELIAKAQPRLFVGNAADKLSPVPLPPLVRRGFQKRP